jgi:hypothetical protein
MTVAQTSDDLPVLAVIRRHKGRIQDREYGGAITTLADAIDRDDVRKIRLGDGIVRHGEPTLADDVPPGPLYVEWGGLARLLLANDGVPCAAYIAADAEGLFAGALRFHFVAAIDGVPLLFPAMPIVDARPTGAQLSRVDRLRIRAGCPAAQDANRRELARMDRAVLEVDGYFVRVPPGPRTNPAPLVGAVRSGAWRTWPADSHNLQAALSSTAVDPGYSSPVYAVERSDDVKTWVHRLAGFSTIFGPRAALELLSLAERQAKLN